MIRTSPTITNANRQMRKQIEIAGNRLKHQEKKVSHLQRESRRDPLTGAMNRLAMEEDLPNEFARNKRYNRAFSIVMADIDHFKNINDTHGHAIGDEVLKFFVQQLQKSLRSVDLIYRYGGEEFLILLPETHAKGAVLVAERLRKSIDASALKHRDDPSIAFRVTSSFGVSVIDNSDSSHMDIIKRADKALAGMGPGIMMADEVNQMEIMDRYCSKPIFFSVSPDRAVERAKELHKSRGNIFISFCLTRHPLEVNENIADYFVNIVKADIPVFNAALPMAGISAPYCYNGVLSTTHAEVLFAICAAQLLNPGCTCVHGGLSSIADPRFDYSPNYGLQSHFILNLLMAHLNMMLDLPTIQSAGTTNETCVTRKALEDVFISNALCKKYGFHMIRHSFGFLRGLIDFSIEKEEILSPILDELDRSQIKREDITIIIATGAHDPHTPEEIIACVGKKIDVVVSENLSEKELSRIFLKKADTVENALEDIRNKEKSDFDIAFLASGADIIPIVN